MSHIMDVRAAGGDLVVIGDSIVLPTSNAAIIVGAEPLTASVRFNPEINRTREDNNIVVPGALQVYLPVPAQNGDWQWENIGVDRNGSLVMYTSGSTMTGDLTMRGVDNGYLPHIYLQAGTVQNPGLAFDLDHSTGLYFDTATATLRTAVQGSNVLVANATALLVQTDLYATNAHFYELWSELGHIQHLDGNTAVFRDIQTDTLEANTGTIHHVISNLVEVVLPLGDDPLAITQIEMTVRSETWFLRHLLDHSFTFNYQGTDMLTLYDNAAVQMDTLYARQAYIQSATINNLTSDTIRTDKLFANTGTITDLTFTTGQGVDLTTSNSVNTLNLNFVTGIGTDLTTSNSVNTTNLNYVTAIGTDLTARNSVTTTDLLASRSVTTTDLTAHNSVTTATVNTTQLNYVTAVGTDLVASHSVTTVDLHFLTADGQDLKAANSVTTDTLNAQTVNANTTNTQKMQADEIDARVINASESITTPAVKAQTVDATSSVTTPAVNAQTVSTGSLTAQDVSSATVEASTSVTTPAVNAQAVATTTLTAQDVSAATIEASTSVTTPQVSAQIVDSLTVTATTMTAGDITASHAINSALMVSQDVTIANAVTATFIFGGTLQGGSIFVDLANADTLVANTFVANTANLNNAYIETFTANTANIVSINAATITAGSVTVNLGSISEIYLADAEYPVGTVMMIGGNAEITQSTYQTGTAIGVVSGPAGVLLNDAMATGGVPLPITLTGRALCNVTGPVNAGDLLEISETPGYARSNDNAALASLVGRALYSFDPVTANSTTGTIVIKVG